MLKKYEYLFPAKPSIELAGIVADLIGDGNLQGEPKWRFDFVSKDKNELNRFAKQIFELYKIKGKIRPCTTNKFGETFLYGVNCKPLARILYLSGVPYGAKVLTEFNIPSWILEDKEYFRSFINRLFYCEGTVDYSNSPFIEIKMYKADYLIANGVDFFETIKKYLFLYFGIISNNVYVNGKSFRKDGIITLGVRLKIKRKKEVLRFVKEIGFPKKEVDRNKLMNIINRNF